MAEAEFRSKIESAVHFIKTWDWGHIEDERYLEAAKRIVGGTRTMEEITWVS
jgi:hypothetical protein